MLEDFEISSFKDTYGSYEDYLLDRLNSDGSITISDFDAKKVSRGFVSSDLFF